MSKILTVEEAKEIKNLQIITYWRKEKASDLAIRPMKGVRIGTKENPRIVDCNLNIKARKYNHFEWLEDLKKKINMYGDPAFIIERKAAKYKRITERALGVIRQKEKTFLQGI